MRTPSQVSWATLLLCCTAVSLTTSIAVALAYHQLQATPNGREKGGRTVTKNNSKRHVQSDTEASEDSPAVKEDEKKHADGPLASLEALLSSVEELLEKQGNTKEKPQPEEEKDPLCGLEETPSASEDPVLSTKALLASVEEILAREHKQKPVEAEPEVDAESVEKEEVPTEMRVDTYFSPDHIAAFDHSDIFRGHSNVSAVIDAIRPYLEKFFREGAWAAAHPQANNATILKTGSRFSGRFVGDSGDSDTDEDDESVASMDAAMTSQWRLPECIDPTEATDVVLYPGVDSRTFSPEKIINLDPTTPAMAARGDTRSSVQVTNHQPQKKHIVVLPGAMILGGVFDVSEGSIFIGKHARIEHNAYIKGPCIIGDHSTVRSGSYLGGDLIIGNHVLLRGELKNALVMDHTELRHPGYFGDSICGVNRRVLGPQELESRA